MQVLATAALAACVWLGFVVSAGADSLLTQAFNVMLGSFGLDAIFVASAETVAGGIMLGLLLGGVLALADERSYGYWVGGTLALLPFLLSWLSLTGRSPLAPEPLHALANFGWLGLPLLAGTFGIWRNSLPTIAIGAVLVLVQPLNLVGNDVSAIFAILGFIFCFMLYIELAYGHLRYARLARIMNYSGEFGSVLNWFGIMLLLTLGFTTLLTVAAFGFHDLLGNVLPPRFHNFIEFNTIYGRALSVMVFFALWAIAQTIFSRQFLARQVE
jgi:hypothetical protein